MFTRRRCDAIFTGNESTLWIFRIFFNSFIVLFDAPSLVKAGKVSKIESNDRDYFVINHQQLKKIQKTFSLNRKTWSFKIELSAGFSPSFIFNYLQNSGMNRPEFGSRFNRQQSWAKKKTQKNNHGKTCLIFSSSEFRIRQRGKTCENFSIHSAVFPTKFSSGFHRRRRHW